MNLSGSPACVFFWTGTASQMENHPKWKETNQVGGWTTHLEKYAQVKLDYFPE